MLLFDAEADITLEDIARMKSAEVGSGFLKVYPAISAGLMPPL